MFKHILFLFIVVSCQTYQLTQSTEKLKDGICLNATGKGRIIVKDQKQVFSFESFFNPAELTLDLDLTFPVYGTETVSVNYIGTESRYEIDSSFERRMLREQKELNPDLIDSFLNLWAEFYEDLLVQKKLTPKDLGTIFSWDKGKDELLAQAQLNSYSAKFKFLYLSESGFFERMDIETSGQNPGDKIKLELIVRKCLRKQSE